MKKIIIAILILLPTSLFASVEITEIMYDISGTDTGREWIEILNTSSDSINVTNLKLFEANTNHTIKIFQGSEILSQNGYAVIADNPEKFLEDWPSFSGTIFDSSFSLSNTGETLIIRDGDNNDLNSVSYSGENGAGGDGNSLQKVSGVWSPGLPTPGAPNNITGEVLGVTSDNNNQESDTKSVQIITSDSSDSSSSRSLSNSVSPKLTVSAGKDILSAAGSPVFFVAEVNKEYQARNSGVDFEWSFGDGSMLYGQSVSHYYKYPGDYVVIVSARTEDRRADDRLNVKIIDPKLSLNRLPDGGIEISNSSSNEINLYKWSLVSGEARFVLPKNTIVRSNSKIAIAPEVSGLPTIQTPAVLYNPQDLPEAFYNIPLSPTVQKIAYQYDRRESNDTYTKSEEALSTEVVSAQEAKNTEDDGQVESQAEGQVAGASTEFEIKKEQGFFRKILGFIGSIFK